MRKLTFSVGLIILIALSVFSSLEIKEANAQVMVPKNYIQTVNDWDINQTYCWENFTIGLDPDAYALINNGSDSCFTAYCKRVGADEWGDCIARQGYTPHDSSYCRDWNNKIIKPMIHYPYIPADIGNDQIILQATGKHSAPVWYGNRPPLNKAPQGPTLGATVMFYFNVYVHDNINGGDKWLFNFHEPNVWAGPNMFLLEVFLTRWVVPWIGSSFESSPPGSPWFEMFCVGTTHDADWHFLTCPFEMSQNDQWYYFLYDVGNKLREAVEKIEEWSTIDMP